MRNGKIILQGLLCFILVFSLILPLSGCGSPPPAPGPDTLSMVQVLTSSGLADSPWPKFRQNTRNTGRSSYAGPETPELKWMFTTGGAVSSSPTIAVDGTIYVSSYDENLYAINPDGTEKWRFTIGMYAGYGLSSPTIGADGTAYMGSRDGYLYAINPDGTEKWRFASASHISDSSPAIGVDGTVYIGSGNGYLYAIDPDGTEKWSAKTLSHIRSSPAIGVDGTIYVGGLPTYDYAGKMFAISPDGTEKWTLPTDGRSFSSPAIGPDGTIYVGTDVPGHLYAIDPDGTEKWRFAAEGSVLSSPGIASDGTVYVGSIASDGGGGGRVYAVNPDGTERWSFATGSWVQSSPAIGADGTIYVGSYDGNFYALNPDGTERWSFATGSWVKSSPAIGADGTVYVGSFDGNLYAISEGTPENGPADSPWPMFGQNAQRTAASSYTGPETPELKWRHLVDGTHRSGPVVGEDGTIYVTISIGYGDYWDGHLRAINPDGTEKWRFDPPSLVSGYPAIGTDGIIYVGGSGSHAVNLDGSENWTFTTQVGLARGAPAIGSDGTIYFGCTGNIYSSSGRLYAVNPNGNEKWSLALDGEGGAPAISHDGMIYMTAGAYYIYAIHPDGTQEWSFVAEDILSTRPAIGVDGTIYIGLSDSNLCAINPDGTEKWRFAAEAQIRSVSIATDGVIYVGSWDGNLYAVYPDGTEKWRFAAGGNVDCSAVGADGTVYIGSDKLYAVNPNGNEKWSLSIGTDVQSMAIGACGTIYVLGDDRWLYAIGEAEPPPGTQIWDWYDLDAVRNDLSGSYVLMRDLDTTTAGYAELAGPEANDGKGWQPIRDETTYDAFVGKLNGQGHEIRNLFINRPDEDYVGLFGRAGGTSAERLIQDLGVVNATVAGRMYVGALLGQFSAAVTVVDCRATGSVTGYQYVGGLVGSSYGNVVDSCFRGTVSGFGFVGGLIGWTLGSSYYRVTGSYSAGTVTGETQVGGLVGESIATVLNCYSTSAVTGGGYVGGLIGVNRGVLAESYSTGIVTGTGCVGGLVGYNYDLWGSIWRCYSSSMVSGKEVVGGLVGRSISTIGDSYATGSVTGDVFVGGLVGLGDEGRATNSFWDMQTSGRTTSSGGTGKTTAEMHDIRTFSDPDWSDGLDAPWDITGVPTQDDRDTDYIWNIVNGTTYPFLSWAGPDHEVPENHPPVALVETLGVTPKIMHPNEPYTVYVAYMDPDGREDLKYCYLLLNHPTKPLTLRWERATDEYSALPGEKGADYVAVTGITLPMSETNYDLRWTFTLKDTWPEVDEAINFGVAAVDNQGAESGWSYDDTKASFLLTNGISISPRETIIGIGGSQAYTAQAIDVYGNTFDATAETEFTISADAGGSWVGNTYESEHAGIWSITANYRGLKDSVTLTIYNYKIAYIPVRYRGEEAPVDIYWLRKTAQLTQQYYFQQSHGSIVLGYDFVFDFLKQLPKTLDEYPDSKVWWPPWKIFDKFDEPQNSIINDAIDLARNEAGFDPDQYDVVVVILTDGSITAQAIKGRAIVSADQPTGIVGQWAHELGHALPHLLWKDYQDPPEGGSIGQWDLMGDGTRNNPPPAIMGYRRVKEGWLEYRTIDWGTFDVKLLQDLGVGDRVLRWHANVRTEYPYYIIEGRHPPDNVILDDRKGPASVLTYEEGILLYGVSRQSKVYSIPHNNSDHYKVTLTGGDSYIDDRGSVTFTAIKEGSQWKIDIQPMIPKSRKVISMSDANVNWQTGGQQSGEPFGSFFDVDLHVYTRDGRKVGMDYDTGRYVLEINDARASGNILGGGPEWISVPDHEDVYFVVDPAQARKWAEEHVIEDLEIDVEVQVILYDDEGKRTQTEPLVLPISLDRSVYCVATATGTGIAGFTTSHGTVEDLEALAVPADPPEGYTFPHGLFSFKVMDLDYDGQTVTVTVDLPTPVPTGTKWRKHHDGQWYDYNIPTTISGNTITITLTDGGVGDIDDIAGQITDPGGPGYPLSLGYTVGWEGQPINRIVVVAPWIALLAVIAGATLMILRSRRAQI